MYYSIHNCGDGSAHPVFFESELAAEIDQERQIEEFGEGWGEDCSGPVGSPTTDEEYIRELEQARDEPWASERFSKWCDEAIARLKS